MKSKFLESPKLVLILALIAVGKAVDLSCENIYGGTQNDLEALEKAKTLLVGSSDVTVNEE